MSFSGDLEHLPIVDVIQLLNATRKSGILRVKSRKGESQLVFKDGYIVSANHLNNSVRIGEILIDLSIITPGILDRALQEQKNAAQHRKPLIVTLLEKGLVKEEDAYKGLEQLIEMTVVEILTWKKGTFILDPAPAAVSDEYRYYPEKFNGEINVDTQSILMDALRIFDEKMRDGELTEEDLSPEEESPLLSADDLGLTDLDQLERKLPGGFTGLAEFDPCKVHRQKIAETAPALSLPEREELASFLGKFSAGGDGTEGSAHRGGLARSVIFFSSDELVRHAVTTVCKHAGIPVFATGEEQDLDPVIARSLEVNSVPILVLDSPEQSDRRFSVEQLTSLRQRNRGKYPGICAIQLASPRDAALALQAYDDGVRAVFPRPLREEQPETFVADTIRFLRSFQSYLKDTAFTQEIPPAGRLKTAVTRLHGCKGAPEVALLLLEIVAGMFERSLTLIVRESELIAEKGIGVRADKSLGTTLSLGFRIPLAKPSLFRTVIEEGQIYYGKAADEVVREQLFAAIGAPLHSTVLLLPIKSRGKTLALTYGDFGGKELARVDIDQLEILASQAELILENSLYRKKLEKPAT